MQRLEGVRLEVDSRRRTVAELARKIDRQRAKLPQTRSKGEFEMEQTIKKMQHKENKLSGNFITPILSENPFKIYLINQDILAPMFVALSGSIRGCVAPSQAPNYT